MTYALAYLLLSLCAGVLWFCLARFTEDDDVEQQLHGAGASESTERIRALHGLDCFRDAAKENDAPVRRVVQAVDWAE